MDALAADVMVTLEQIRYYEKHAPRLLASRKIGKPFFLYSGAQFYEHREPHGVALVYAPSNYPFQLAVVPAITALVAGNAVLLKCSEKTPGITALIAALFERAPFPPGLVQVVEDQPDSAGDYIDAHPDIVFFTGGTENGRTVALRAAELLIPSVLELGGKDAAIVFADCALDRTIEGIVYGAFSNAGQVCVGIKRLYVEQSIFARFLSALTERVKQLRIGSTANCDFGNLNSNAARSRLIEQVRSALSEGATLVFPPSPSLSADQPIIVTNVAPDARLLVEETFGPVLCVAPFATEQEAITLANSSAFALSASIWTRDLIRARRVAALMSAGTCSINDVIRNIGNPYASFGGNRSSGYGRYHGPHGLYAFSRSKSVMVMSGRNKREIHWFPFTQHTFSRLNALIGLRHLPGQWRDALRRLFLPLLLSATVLPGAFAEDAVQPHLKITVTIPADSHGSLRYLIFNSPAGFPDKKAKAVRSGTAEPPPSSSKFTFDVGPLQPGRYAVTVYQDINGNGKLDAGLFGIPKEPVGASNNPKPHYGPPHFDESAIQIDHSNLSISISLVKPK